MKYDDGSYDVYTCPECNEEFFDFEDMISCYKTHIDDFKQVDGKKQRSATKLDFKSTNGRKDE